jgi:hypothetical protein
MSNSSPVKEHTAATSSHSSDGEEPSTKRHMAKTEPLDKFLDKEYIASQIFANERTSVLMRKYFAYKLMGSDFFINHSLTMMGLCYRVLGIRPTNFCINNSVGDLFTSGETMDTLVSDVKDLREKNIRSLVSFAVEGIHEHDEARIKDFFEQTIDTINSQSAPDREGHVALKLTGFMDTGMMTRISTA